MTPTNTTTVPYDKVTISATDITSLNIDENVENKVASESVSIGSQLVHDRFTIEDLGVCVSSDKEIDLPDYKRQKLLPTEVGNGSQIVHKRFNNEDLKLGFPVETGVELTKVVIDESIQVEGSIGSQTVHKRFTNTVKEAVNTSDIGGNLANTMKNLLETDENVDLIIDYKRFTNKDLIAGIALETEIILNDVTTKELSLTENNSGSQTVHEWFTYEDLEIETSENGIDLANNAMEGLLQTEANNGSQTVQNLLTEKELAETKISRDIKHADIDSNSDNQISVSRLIGNQRDIVIALYKNMRVNKSDTTEELTLEMIAELSRVNIKSLKNTLFRLTKGGYLKRSEQKNGRGGWVKYKINEKIVNEIQEKDYLINTKKIR